jgi:hypothetical protein
MDKELEILLKYLPGGKDVKIMNLERDIFLDYTDKILNAGYMVSYAGLRYGDLHLYLSGLILPKPLFSGLLDFEKLKEYQLIKGFGEGFFESGETSGFKETVLYLKDYTQFLKCKLLESYNKKNKVSL